MNSRPGKAVAQNTYLHIDLLPQLSDEHQDLVARAEQIVGVSSGSDFNVIRLDNSGETVSFLDYPEFFDDPFPALTRSWKVDLSSDRTTFRTYSDSRNPPILHRKEHLLPPDHPKVAEYAALTKTAETIGLFDNTTRIGFRENWRQLIAEKGYQLIDGQFAPLANIEAIETEEEADFSSGQHIERHRTALIRYNFSAPVQALLRHGLLKNGVSFFDYGCGRGDDIRGLLENNIQAAGWDPHYAPENTKQGAEVVNLGFVINVIEDSEERMYALCQAYNLTERVLAVSTMLANSASVQGRPYKDGFLTQRKTFQKYYSQVELRDYIEHTLDESALPVGPGVFFVFRDKDHEQRFVSNRYRSRRGLLTQGWSISRPERQPRSEVVAAAKYEQHRDVLDGLWNTWLDLGRKPDRQELNNLSAIEETFGTLNRALRFLTRLKDLKQVEAAANARTNDLLVYFALQQFEHRKPYRHLENELRRDIKVFFGNYVTAQETARRTLFQIADSGALGNACLEASQKGLGHLEEGKSLQLDTSLVPELPVLLRIYVGCATVLYGDVSNADLVKIHIGSGKLTLMKTDDFEGLPLPRLVQRIKLKFREQDIETFNYGEEYPCPLIYHKSRYINEEFPRYADQIAFEESFDDLVLFDLSGYGPPADKFFSDLEAARREVVDFTLGRSRSIPELDTPCGRYLTFRDLIECGETQKRTGLPNLPKQPDTYNALYDLAVNVLDPVIDYFGMIKLTYGFCSPELSRKIKGGIAPKLDQHSAHEINRLGNIICPRLGAAVDFIVEDEDMLEVTEWILTNTDFDRLYYYGPDQPIHVSYGPDLLHEAIKIDLTHDGRRIPKRGKFSITPQC